MPYDLRDFVHYGKNNNKKKLYMTLWLLSSLFLMLSFLQALCSIFFHDAVLYPVVDARLTLQKSPELSLLAILACLVLYPAHSRYPRLPEIPTLSTPLRKTQIYLYFTFLLHAMRIPWAVFWGLLLDSVYLFCSLRNQCTALTFIPCLKTLVSYILYFFSCLRRKCNSSSYCWIFPKPQVLSCFYLFVFLFKFLCSV